MFRARHPEVTADGRSDNGRGATKLGPRLAGVSAGLLVAVAICLGCGDEGASPSANPVAPSGPQGTLANLVGPYLGQTPPGTSFVRFAPGIVPGDIYNSPTVSPDGREIYWAARDGIMVTTMTPDGRWTTPQTVSLGGTLSRPGDDAPVVSPDNRTLFFNVRTPGTPSGYSYWQAERTASGWSAPQPLPGVISSIGANHYHVSVSGAGTLYFAANQNVARIYRARFVGGTYEVPAPVDAANSVGGNVIAPFVAPDESYLLFTQILDGRLGGHYVSFKGQDGQWAAPRTLDGFPPDAETYFVTRDGQYVFSRCYWASARIIENVPRAGR